MSAADAMCVSSMRNVTMVFLSFLPSYTSLISTRPTILSYSSWRGVSSLLMRSLSPRSYCNQVQLRPISEDGKITQMTWPACSTAKYYRITSTIDDKASSFGLKSSVENKMRWTLPSSGQSQQVTITPINAQGNELLDHRLTKQITVENISRPNLSNESKTKSAAPILSEISYLDIRIGKIIDIKVHPEADSLYIESVDVGEAQPRVIVSGLVKYCTIDELLHRPVVVLCNLKPRALKGVVSHGMLLCASNADHTEVEPIIPPPNSIIGERIQFDGYVAQPTEPSNRVNKAFDRVVNDLKTSSDGVATFQGKTPFMTSLGPCSSRIKEAKIS